MLETLHDIKNDMQIFSHGESGHMHTVSVSGIKITRKRERLIWLMLQRMTEGKKTLERGAVVVSRIRNINTHGFHELISKY